MLWGLHKNPKWRVLGASGQLVTQSSIRGLSVPFPWPTYPSIVSSECVFLSRASKLVKARRGVCIVGTPMCRWLDRHIGEQPWVCDRHGSWGGIVLETELWPDHLLSPKRQSRNWLWAENSGLVSCAQPLASSLWGGIQTPWWLLRSVLIALPWERH